MDMSYHGNTTGVYQVSVMWLWWGFSNVDMAKDAFNQIMNEIIEMFKIKKMYIK